MQGGMGNFEPAKFIPFHFVKLASLTSLVKDKFRGRRESNPGQLGEKRELCPPLPLYGTHSIEAQFGDF